MHPARLPRLAARVVVLAMVVMAGIQTTAAPAQAAYPVPPTPAGLPSTIEDYQTYVGQSLCDPVAKPGVSAFRDLLLRTYSGTSSLGIVRDCGSGGTSEHKEGRAFDWGVLATNTTQAGQAKALLDWLVKTDAQGNPHAMARRFGIMYLIWNRKIWKSYQSERGWQDYSGSNPHTDHVHVSFGWSGAKKQTSYWDNTVAPFDPGPAAAVTPVRSSANLAIVRTYGTTTLASGATGTAVSTVQRPLRLVVDGSYGSQTVAAVKRFQSQQGMTVSGSFGPAEWKQLFPPPINPFGTVESSQVVPGSVHVSGWALDADSSTSLSVNVSVDGTQVTTGTASLERPDIATRYPGLGSAHGFSVALQLTEGLHKVCATAVNAAGTPGVDGTLTCANVTATHLPSGALETAVAVLGKVHLTGWAVDPDTAEPVSVSVTVDGAAPIVVPAGGDRPELATSWPGFGTNHGFVADVAADEGTRHVCVSAVNSGTGVDRPLGCSDVVVRHAPDGVLSSVGLRPGGVLATGWGLDPDVTDAVPVIVTVNGTRKPPVTADQAGAPVPAPYAANGTNHAFTQLLSLPEGTHTLCAIVANANGTPGAETPAGCRTLTARHGAQGRFETLRTVPGGGLLVRGWALDPDVAASTAVQVSVDGSVVRTVTANVARSDVGATWPGYGNNHGFSTTLSLSTGRHKVCVTAVNAARTAGANTSLGCLSVVLGIPSGGWDPVKAGTGTISVSGWVLDPDVKVASGWVLRVDGVTVASGKAALHRIGFATAHPGYGGSHGFRASLRAARGARKVCLTAVNVANTRGSNRNLGCVTVTVR